MQRASRRRWERRPASAIPTIHGSGAPTRTPMAFSGTGSRRARASTMSATARCRRHAIHSTGDHASVSSGSVPGRSTTTSSCTCSEDSPPIPAARIRGMEKSSEKQSCAGSMRSWDFQQTLSRAQRITAPTSTAPSLLRTSSSMSATMSFWLAAQVSHMQTWKKRKSSARCRFGRQLMR